MKPTQWIWQNGQLKKWADATVHVAAHGLQYGTSIIEGLRSYDTVDGPAIFRLDEHVDRLFQSAKLYRMQIPFTQQQIKDACCQLLIENELGNSYIRPIAYRDVLDLGLASTTGDPVGVAVLAIEWDDVYGEKEIEDGISVCVSSWSRLQNSSNPVMAKASGHYMNSQLIAMEARINGYSDGIAINDQGMVTEVSGSNLFMVRKGKMLTASLGCSILEGITRDTIIQLAGDEGIEIVETNIPRDILYIADEVFLCGTASEITPIGSIDRIPVGSGKAGPMTIQLRKQFRELVGGRHARSKDWLTPIG